MTRAGIAKSISVTFIGQVQFSICETMFHYLAHHQHLQKQDKTCTCDSGIPMPVANNSMQMMDNCNQCGDLKGNILFTALFFIYDNL